VFQRTMQGPLALPAGIGPPADWEPYDDVEGDPSRDGGLTGPDGDVVGVHEGAVEESSGRGTGVSGGSGAEGEMLEPAASSAQGGTATATRPARSRTSLPRMTDLRGREVLAVAPLIALMILLGFYPKPLTDVITPAVNFTLEDAGRSDPAPTQGQGEPAASTENG
jgi:hypothetical protein